MFESRPNVLILFSVKKNSMISENIDFNRNVIDEFCNIKKNRSNFLYTFCQ